MFLRPEICVTRPILYDETTEGANIISFIPPAVLTRSVISTSKLSKLQQHGVTLQQFTIRRLKEQARAATVFQSPDLHGNFV
jgi:hypothetical protein